MKAYISTLYPHFTTERWTDSTNGDTHKCPSAPQQFSWTSLRPWCKLWQGNSELITLDIITLNPKLPFIHTFLSSQNNLFKYPQRCTSKRHTVHLRQQNRSSVCTWLHQNTHKQSDGGRQGGKEERWRGEDCSQTTSCGSGIEASSGRAVTCQWEVTPGAPTQQQISVFTP